MASPTLEEIPQRTIDRSAFSHARIPEYASAILEALSFRNGSVTRLEALNERDWKRALDFCDQSQLTLLLGHFCGRSLPGWVAARIAANATDNIRRQETLKAALFEMTDALDAQHIDFVLLKGMTHSPEFTPDPALRAQNDCDLWFRQEDVLAARDILTDLGYLAVCAHGRRHLPPMARPSDWKWDGNYFSPDIPVSVDLHYQLWDGDQESFAAPGEDAFWARRRELSINGHSVGALSTQDTLGFAALHVLMHLLQGDARLQRAWEIANFLNTHAADDDFWRTWQCEHDRELRKLEVIVFALASRWFRCDLHASIEQEINDLPNDVALWLDKHAMAPIEAIFRPNKNEIWLHLALIDDSKKRFTVLCRRLFPFRAPNSLKRVASASGATPISRRRFRHAAKRVLFHARVLFPTLLSGARWLWLRQQFDRNYVRYLIASAFFDLGMLVFVLLYNLYLLDLGLREHFMGQVAGSMTAGTLAGAIPAAWLIRRLGLRNAMATAMVGVAAASALRVFGFGNLGFLVTAFVHGLFLSFWVVSFSPAVAGLSQARNRQIAFSLVFALGMGLGIPGGIAGGHLPNLLMQVGLATDLLAAKRAALLVASGLILLGVGPMLTVRFPKPQETERKVYPRNRFVIGFLIWLSVWSFATTAFNPFFNTYLSQHLHFSVERIGNVFSWSQLFQVLAVLMMPVILRIYGEGKGIAATQLMTGLLFALLTSTVGGVPAAAIYVACMSFQYMTGPSVYGMLMSHVSVEERSGASALNFVVSSVCGMLSAVAAGSVISRFGYSALLTMCALLAGIAALLFWLLLRFHKAFTTPEPNSSIDKLAWSESPQ